MTQFQTHLRFHGGKPSDQIAIKSNKKCGLLSVHKTVLDGQWTHDGWLVMGKIHYEHFEELKTITMPLPIFFVIYGPILLFLVLF